MNNDDDNKQQRQGHELRPWVRHFRAKPFATGVVITVCVMSLYQDYMGLDGYVAHVREHWVEPWVTVPVAIVGIFAMIVGRLVDVTATDAEEGRDDD